MLLNYRWIIGWTFLIPFVFLIACGSQNQEENATNADENDNDQETVEETRDEGQNLQASNDASAQRDGGLIEDDEGEGGLLDEEEEAPIELEGEGEVELEEGEVEIVSPEQFNELRQGAGQVVDVRTPSEYRENQIPGAMNIDFTDIGFFNEVQKLDDNEPVLIYCDEGRLSPEAASLVSVEGFPEVYILEGGIENWQLNDFEVE